MASKPGEPRDDDAFLSRWSRRKVQVARGLPVAERPPPEPAMPAAAPVAPKAVPVPAPPAESRDDAAPAAPPPPTLDDVALLRRDSDFSPFVRRGVAPDVKNAALKKLFSDPHFNIMDGLDTYIDDYGKPDPLPAGMLRKMVGSQLLGLFDHEKTADPAEPPPLAADAAPETLPHEDPDLRLQPDDDAGRAGAEPGPGEDAGRQR